ncbi:hypothetical protein EG68_01693 [Paragonimus skrjabini miyazakii]|uniref:Sugar phosphate exchanger 3 n=1 Tax=Paragonimus skrjabini miyazakii TaxID=59628 RepID=A0A8S9Z5J5_9TREM|nr:hypothetical protein EG68_01693 [Paragonimus skrjabini miyazakii]
MFRTAPIVMLFRCCLRPWNGTFGRIYVFLSTFVIYLFFHASRKPISVVKSVWHSNCTTNRSTTCGWKPFDGSEYSALFGWLDMIFLVAYSVGLFFSGHIADRFHLRKFLGLAAILCGLTSILIGSSYFLEIHSLAFFMIMQLISGAFQAMGWPAVVASMGNWFGRARRGLLFGLWNTHGSTGNIVGSVIAGAFVDTVWAWSFIVPGILICVCGLYALLCLVPYPEEVGVEPPEREITKEVEYVVAENFTEDTLALSVDLPEVTDLKMDLTKVSISATKPVSIMTALRVPGVVEYSLCLFFAKLVSYTFLFWLPKYIRDTGDFDPSTAADLSSLFDLGGIIGGILAGALTDWTAASATVCSVMLLFGVPLLYVYYAFGALSVGTCVGCLIPLGMLVNGPFGLITTAVAADLGTHPSLRSDTRALATVTGIIDGTGSMGAALGPLLCGQLVPYGWKTVYIMLMVSLAFSAVLLFRRVVYEIGTYIQYRKNTQIRGCMM